MKVKGDNMVLLDSNILIYAEQLHEEQHEVAKSLRDRALAGGISACISPQILGEFFSVVTNTGPRGPEHTLTAQEATDQIQKYHEAEHLTIIYPGRETIQSLLTLLASRPVVGPGFYDVMLAATMLGNGVSRIATYNIKDFTPLPGITVVNPSELIMTNEEVNHVEPD